MRYVLVLIAVLFSVTHARSQSLAVSEILIGDESRGWIELVNVSDDPIDLDGFTIQLIGGADDNRSFVPVSQALGPLAAGGRTFICLGFGAGSCDESGGAAAGLSLRGGTLILFFRPDCRSALELVDEFTYPPSQSTARAETFGREEPIAAFDIVHTLEGFTAKEPNSDPVVEEGAVVINEISTAENVFVDRGTPELCDFQSCPDWIELYFSGDGSIDLTGYRLINGNRVFTFPPGSTLSDKERYLVVASKRLVEGELPQKDWLPYHADFSLRRGGDGLLLTDTEGVIDRVSIPTLDGGESVSRTPDGGDWFVVDDPTPGRRNSRSAAGSPPKINVFDRFPIRLVNGTSMKVFAEVNDLDGDLMRTSIELIYSLDDGVERRLPMRPGKRRTARRIPEDDVYEADTPELPLGKIQFRVEARDNSGNLTASENVEALVQRADWSDPSAINPTHFLRINEVLANSPGGGHGWVEIYNSSPDSVISLDGMIVTNDLFLRTNRELPPRTLLAPGQYLIIRLDDTFDPNPTSPRLPFRLASSRDEVALIHSDGMTVVDAVEWHEEKSEKSLGRFPDGGDVFSIMLPTLGAENRLRGCLQFGTELGDVVINEIVSDNWTVIADEGEEYGDYLELFNRTTQTIDLSGWSLHDLGGVSDEYPQPKSWFFPTGVQIPPGGHLLLWCDNDTCENPDCTAGDLECYRNAELHTNFEINRMREFVALVNPESHAVDCVSIGFQPRDVSVGRIPDGSPEARYIDPSPGAANTPWTGVDLSLETCAQVDLLNGFEAELCDRIQGPPFVRGDSNDSCDVDISDAITTLSYLFVGAQRPNCLDAADANDSGTITLTDAIVILTWLFRAGPMPPAPGSVEIGFDTTFDTLVCEPDCSQ